MQKVDQHECLNKLLVSTVDSFAHQNALALAKCGIVCYLPFMNKETNCPKCKSENIYFDGNLWICPECGHEWTSSIVAEAVTPDESQDNVIRDANGNVLNNGDSITVIKELRIKGSSSVVKVGTKVKNIRLVDGGDGHDIACKIDGIGAINLKSEFVRKA